MSHHLIVKHFVNHFYLLLMYSHLQ
jgi:hypothetical protein